MTLKRGPTYLFGVLLMSMSLLVARLCVEVIDVGLAVLLALAVLGIEGGIYLAISALLARPRTPSSALCVEYESRDDMLTEDLIRAMRFTDGESYERAQATVILRMACRLDGKQPSSAEELLKRLTPAALARTGNAQGLLILDRFTVEDIYKVRVRCFALGQLDQMIGR